MSTEPAPPVEEMDRDALEEELQELRERQDEIEKVGTVMAKFVNSVAGYERGEGVKYNDPEFIPEAVAALTDLADQVDELENTVKRVDSTVKQSRSATGSTDDEHWWDVVEAAHNLKDHHEHGLPNNWVKLFRENISQATGLSKKRGQQLIDEWTDESQDTHKRGTKKQSYQPATAGNKGQARRKAIKINLDVWEEQ